MPWVRIDDQFYSHPKLALLGSMMLPCVGLHALALCYCNAYLTDGVVPHNQVPRLAGDLSLLLPEGHPWALVGRLIDAGLWEYLHDDPEDSDYLIHDYLDYNPSRKDVEKTRKERALAGRAGGLAKAKQTPSKRLSNEKQKSAPAPVPSPTDKKLRIQLENRDDLSISRSNGNPEKGNYTEVVERLGSKLRSET